LEENHPMIISSKFNSYWANDFRQEDFYGITQGSFQQSLDEIGSVFSEEKIFFKFHPPFFLFLAWRPPWLEVRIPQSLVAIGRVVSEKIKMWNVDGRTKSDGNSSPGWAKND
jgi:hypothetical protein